MPRPADTAPRDASRCTRMEDLAHMTRRPNWASLVAIGAAGLLAATMATTGLAQSPSARNERPPVVGEQPPAPTADIDQLPQLR